MEVFYSKIVFLNVLVLNLVWLLMNFVWDVWDNGLGFSFGELGYNVMDYYYMLGGMVEIDGYFDKYVYGCRLIGFYIFWFVNWGNDKWDFLCGFGFQGNVLCFDFSCNVDQLGIGVSLKDGLSELGLWSVSIVGFGEILLDYCNKVILNYDVRDVWGLFVLELDVKICNNELKMCKVMKEDIVEMFDSIGLKNVMVWELIYYMGKGIYEMGIVCMGCDLKILVFNKYNQVWDVLNVFVIDGVCMMFFFCVNLFFIYMVLIVWVVDFVVEELKWGNL